MFFYVYILQSIQVPEHFYVGLTEDLHHRLARHNEGEVPHTAKFKPWRDREKSRSSGPLSCHFSCAMRAVKWTLTCIRAG